jgi:glycosyltransferase involved in cell wall biosynthesis
MAFTQLKLIRAISTYDLIYVRSHYATFPTVLIAKIFRTPVILEVNGPYQDLFLAWPATRFFSGLFVGLMKAQMRLSNSIIVVTPQLKQWVEGEIGRKEIEVVPNGADVEHFYPGAENCFQFEENYVIFFGALAVWQGIEDILKAAGSNTWPNDLLLVIAGDGKMKDEVLRFQNEHKHIKYLGVVPYQEIPGLISESLASLVCMNNAGRRSDTGLSPLKMYESLACGVPVIASDLPGISDFVQENDCGLIVPMNSPVSIAEAVASLLSDQKLRNRLGRNGFNVVTKEHTWHKRAIETDQVIQRIVSSD